MDSQKQNDRGKNRKAAPPKQSRFRSWALWAGLLGSLWLIASALGLPQKIGLTDENFNTIVSALGAILTLLGVVNDPTNPRGI